MDLRKLQRVVVDALEDVKGQDIRVFDTQGLTGLFDRVVVVSGTSNRQTRALAASVRDKVREAGGHVISVEGEDGGEWVLVDLGDVVVHVMQPAIRSYYNLEELWGAKPVRVRLGGRRPARASEPAEPADAPAKAPAGAARRRAPAARAPRAPRAARTPSA
jgi:ribosome-associated protein